jgi:hypothetical protein
MNMILLSSSLSLIISLALLSSIHGQSRAGSEEISKWIRTKMNDPKVATEFQEHRAIIDKVCDPLFNPEVCWERQIKGLEMLLALSRKDSELSKGGRETIQSELAQLQSKLSRWKALPQAQKEERLKIAENLIDTVKKSGNAKKGLQQIETDPKQNQRTRGAARKAAEGVSKICINCLCVQEKGCPCCDYDEIVSSLVE